MGLVDESHRFTIPEDTKIAAVPCKHVIDIHSWGKKIASTSVRLTEEQKSNFPFKKKTEKQKPSHFLFDRTKEIYKYEPSKGLLQHSVQEISTQEKYWYECGASHINACHSTPEYKGERSVKPLMYKRMITIGKLLLTENMRHKWGLA